MSLKYNLYQNRHYLAALVASVFALGSGIRSCRLNTEKSILEKKIEELTGKPEDAVINFLKNNPGKVREYLPAFVRVAKEKGYLKDLIANLSTEERMGFMKYILKSERNSFLRELANDAQFVDDNEDYLHEYKKSLDVKKWHLWIDYQNLI